MQSRKALAAAALCVAALCACHKNPVTPDPEPEPAEKGKKDWPAPQPEKDPVVDYTKWKIEHGKFYLDGKRVFLKIAKPLLHFINADNANHVINALDTLRAKRYNCVEIMTSWNAFDPNGDGVLDVSLSHLNRLIEAVYERGMIPCINVGNYSVGGSGVPDAFFERHPEAQAIDRNGNRVTDTEYGTNAKVVDIFNEDYLKASRAYIRAICEGIDHRKILWMETTVEPQYMGTINLCYTESARRAYGQWRKENNITDAPSEMPEGFPIPDAFVDNPTWNTFRARYLARWVNEDAAVWRSVAGPDAYVAVDYLDASAMRNRCGDPIEFLTALDCVDVLQVNWHWNLASKEPNDIAYKRVRQVMEATGRDWAISEHMTFNGSDYSRYNDSQLDEVLENTLRQGTRLGWEFTNTLNRTTDGFCLYNTDWTAKRTMRAVDDYWGWWLHRVEEIESEQAP